MTPVSLIFGRANVTSVVMNAPKCLIEVDEETAAVDIAELDRRWAAIEAGEPTISNDVVVQWLQTWGGTGIQAVA